MFTLTPAGRERLHVLLSQPVRTAPPRNGLLLRLCFGRVLGAAACRELVVSAREDAAQRRGAAGGPWHRAEVPPSAFFPDRRLTIDDAEVDRAGDIYDATHQS